MRVLFGGLDVQTCAIGLIVLRHDPRSSRRHRQAPAELLLLSALQEGEGPLRLYTNQYGDVGHPLWDTARRACPSIAPLQEAPLTGKGHRISVDKTEPTYRVTRYQDSHR
jgi:hypothetical protein